MKAKEFVSNMIKVVAKITAPTLSLNLNALAPIVFENPCKDKREPSVELRQVSRKLALLGSI